MDEQSKRQTESGILLEQAKAQRAAMGEDDLSAKRTQLKQAQENCDRLAEQLKQGEARLQKLEKGISEREVTLRKLNRDYDGARATVRQSLRELNDQNELLRLGKEHEQYVHGIQAERPGINQQHVLAALHQRSRQIDDVLRSLRKEDEARAVYIVGEK